MQIPIKIGAVEGKCVNDEGECKQCWYFLDNLMERECQRNGHSKRLSSSCWKLDEEGEHKEHLCEETAATVMNTHRRNPQDVQQQSQMRFC